MKSLLTKCILLSLLTAGATACEDQHEQQQPPQQQSALVTAANETDVMARLRAIAAAEARYGIESGGEYGTLEQLIQTRYINDPSSGKLTGYRFEVRVKPGGFEATAVPVKFGVTGTRSFYLDETNIMRAADKRGASATASDPEV
jgi:hypothetical protein